MSAGWVEDERGEGGEMLGCECDNGGKKTAS